MLSQSYVSEDTAHYRKEASRGVVLTGKMDLVSAKYAGLGGMGLHACA